MTPLIRATLSVTTLLLAGCGGVAFTALEVPPDDGGLNVVTADADPSEAAKEDASQGLDSSELADAPAQQHDASDAATPPVDAADAATPADACANKPEIVYSCGPSGTLVEYPTAICVNVVQPTGGGNVARDVPPACSSWCTFSCACLASVNICGAGYVLTCIPHWDGTVETDCTKQP